MWKKKAYRHARYRQAATKQFRNHCGQIGLVMQGSTCVSFKSEIDITIVCFNRCVPCRKTLSNVVATCY